MLKNGFARLALIALVLALAGCGSSHNSDQYWGALSKRVGDASSR
jgi:hypothetical protein